MSLGVSFYALFQEENMSRKVIIFIAVALATALFISACTLSASNPPEPTATAAGSTELPTGISLVQAWGTQTAVYQQTASALAATISPTPTPGSLTALPPTGAPGTTPVFTTPASTTPIIVVPTSTPGHPSSYTLQKGEFPYCIARRFDVDPAALLAANGLNQITATDLQPGTVLTIPSSGSFPGTRALHAHPATYTVMLNDTIYSIACDFGDVDPTQIAAANNIALTTPLATGTTRNIP